MKFYRFICRKIGIYEAVDRDCPRNDVRRQHKPDGAWLPKVGPSFPWAISFWTEYGLDRYLQSGLQAWHCSVVRDSVEVIVAEVIDPVLHMDEYQVICKTDSVRQSSQTSIEEFLLRSKLSLQRVDLASEMLIQKILEAAPRYSMNTEGVPSIEGDGRDTLTALPPDCTLDQKHVLILLQNGDPIGVADLIDGFPDKETAFLGLMLLREDHQRKGIGRSFYRMLERKVTQEFRSKRIRLAVVDSNPVLDFWSKMGFRETGVARPHEGKKIRSTKRIMEKELL